MMLQWWNPKRDTWPPTRALGDGTENSVDCKFNFARTGWKPVSRKSLCRARPADGFSPGGFMRFDNLFPRLGRSVVVAVDRAFIGEGLAGLAADRFDLIVAVRQLDVGPDEDVNRIRRFAAERFSVDGQLD